ncbi:MAG: invasion associated locus B family protein [Pseudomonadota bacterium]
MKMRFIGNRGIGICLAVGLSVGAAVPQSMGQAGPSSIRETYGGWAVRCQQATENMQCDMAFEARQQDSQQLILRVTIMRAPDGTGANARILTPFGISLADGLQISVDEGEPFLSAAFRTCIAAGCIARTPVDNDALATIANSEQFQVTMQQLDDGGALNILMPTNGFQAAWQRLAELREES